MWRKKTIIGFSLYQILQNKSNGETESEHKNKTLATKLDNVEVLSGDGSKIEEGIELHSIQIHLDQKRVRYIIFTKNLKRNYIILLCELLHDLYNIIFLIRSKVMEKSPMIIPSSNLRNK